jgi:hypothetical protein
MRTKTGRICSVLVASALSAFLLVAALPRLTLATPLALPPRPTIPPTPSVPPTHTPVSYPTPPRASRLHPGPSGGFIDLQAQFGPAWPWADVHWQELWTVVQLRDHRGGWHDVDGWQGTFDEIINLRGRKVWWVAEEHLGLGQFRWAVYLSPGGRLLATSEPFYLPGSPGDTVTVEVLLEP